MSRILRNALRGLSLVALAAGFSSPASAVMLTAICDDLACSGGNDIIVADNAAGDSIAGVGATTISTAAFGYTVVVNTSQSKPAIGSASLPQLDLTYTATGTGSIFLYVSDTDFTAGGPYALALGGTNSGGSGSVTGRAWGGTNNTALSFSAANLLGSVGPLSGVAYSGTANGSFIPAVSPFSLTLGAAISRTTAGTTTGDLNFSVLVVPEPATWAMMLVGFAGIGFTMRRKKVLEPVTA